VRVPCIRSLCITWLTGSLCSAKENEKHTIMTPFNVISKMFGPYMFSATARETLNEKMEYYFHDHQFMGLFVQVCVHEMLFEQSTEDMRRRTTSRPNLPSSGTLMARKRF
jgi:hypothetical protein